MHKAYTENGLLVLMYLVCSLCHKAIDLLVWPTYELLQVLHFSLYIPFEFILFCGILSLSCLYIVLVARNTIFKLVYLNKLVTLCIREL
jgi:hypothetical protein